MHGFPAGHLYCYFLLFSRYLGFATMAYFFLIAIGKAFAWIDAKAYALYQKKGWL